MSELASFFMQVLTQKRNLVLHVVRTEEVASTGAIS